MKIITISREFGSGGREFGKRLADTLKFDYYDSEIIEAVAKKSGLDTHYVKSKLDNHGWQNIPVSFRGTLRSVGYTQANNVQLLLKQKDVIEEIAKLDKDCVIVGRNADVILHPYSPFNIFVCAELEAKINRCMERRAEDETISGKDLLRKMRQIDKRRAQTRAILTSSAWGNREAYHLIVNTTHWNIKELASAVAEFARCWFGRTQ